MATATTTIKSRLRTGTRSRFIGQYGPALDTGQNAAIVEFNDILTVEKGNYILLFTVFVTNRPLYPILLVLSDNNLWRGNWR